jgi:polyhydroxybutyrate depolymerase
VADQLQDGYTAAVEKLNIRKVLMIVAAIITAILLVIFFGLFTRNDRSLLFQSAKTIDHNGIQRKYRLVLPVGYSTDKSYPVIFALHGFRDTGSQFGLYSGLSNLASEKDVVVVYPEGLEKSWNGQVCCGYSFMNGVDDVGFIKELITEVESQYSIDSKKRYVIGYSNGGLLTQRLIQEIPQTFKAAAVVMSGAGTDEQLLDNSKANTPLLIINGENDSYVPLKDGESNGDGFQFASAEKTVNHWKQQYNATDEQRQENEAYVRTDYNTKQAALVHVIYKNTGHTWPQWRATGPLQAIPESTMLVWGFLDTRLSD